MILDAYYCRPKVPRILWWCEGVQKKITIVETHGCGGRMVYSVSLPLR
jgi:hypothetical protein